MTSLRALALLLVPLSVRGQSSGPPSPTTAAPSHTALVCGADQTRPPDKILADQHGTGDWQRYPGVKDVPELENDAGDAALVWSGREGNTLVRMIEPGEEFWIRTDYCYDKAGQLVNARFDFRTLGEWGYREEGPITGGALVPETSQFFDPKTQAQIAMPDTATYGENLRPQLYMRRSELPFARLLSDGT